MTTVGVTGASGSVGSRVCRLLAQNPAVDRVVGFDVRRRPDSDIEVHVADLRAASLEPLIEECDVVVHLASAFDPRLNGYDPAPIDIEATRRLFDAAVATSLKRLVLLSSAMVYGAWSNNPVPLTEESPIRPNPDFSFATYKAEIERYATEWRRANPGTTVVTLRPTTAVAEGDSSWVAEMLRAAIAINAGDEDPPMQFVHLDDLASAVELAAVGELDGVYNVAPDGFVDFDTVRDLTGRAPRVRISEAAARRMARLGWKWGLATPPGIVPYTIHPWVVANDRLRQAGWVPLHTNEHAYVSGDRPRPWAMMNARTRQRVALGGAGVLLAIAAVVVALLLRRRYRR